MINDQSDHPIKVLFVTGTMFFGEPMGVMQLSAILKKKSIVTKMIALRVHSLQETLDEFKPDVIGLRTLSFFKDFFHKTAAMIRNFGFDVPIIAGGPYATSDYARILHDRNINLVVHGEGEITFSEIIGKIIENDKRLPGQEILKEIPGIAFVPGTGARGKAAAPAPAPGLNVNDKVKEKLNRFNEDLENE